jgi:hypothetical protein
MHGPPAQSPPCAPGMVMHYPCWPALNHSMCYIEVNSPLVWRHPTGTFDKELLTGKGETLLIYSYTFLSIAGC